MKYRPAEQAFFVRSTEGYGCATDGLCRVSLLFDEEGPGVLGGLGDLVMQMGGCRAPALSPLRTRNLSQEARR